MGSNLTIGKRLQVVLGTPLSNYRNGRWVLVCACQQCGAEVDAAIAALLPSYAALTVRQVLGKSGVRSAGNRRQACSCRACQPTGRGPRT